MLPGGAKGAIMFLVVLVSMFMLLAGVGILMQLLYERSVPSNKGGWLNFAGFMFFFAFIFLVLGTIFNLSTYSEQIEKGVELEKVSSFEQTYQVRSDNLAKEFTYYLAGVYPNHEKDIFSKIEPGKLDVYLVKYPELQASKTIVELVQQVRSLQDDIYKQRLERAQTIRDMRYNVRSPWVLQWMMPNVAIPEK